MTANNPADVDRILAEAMGQGDVDRIVGLYEESAVVAGSQGAGPAVGHDAIHQAMGAFAALKPAHVPEAPTHASLKAAKEAEVAQAEAREAATPAASGSGAASGAGAPSGSGAGGTLG